MNHPLRVLIVEDSEDDAYLLLRLLRKSGYEPTHRRVDTAEAMQAALEEQEWDIILSDYNMPGFDGLSALRLYKQSGLDIPFILVSGMIGEEAAVEAMRTGAHDYLMKDNLTRLAPAIQRELQETEVRRARRQAEESLRASEKRYRLLVQHAPSGIYEIDLTNLKFISVNEVMCEYTGYTEEEFLSLNPFDLLVDESKVDFVKRQAQMIAGEQVPDAVEFKIQGKGKRQFWVILRTRLTRENDRRIATVVVHDITERKQAEEALRLYSERLKILREIDQTILKAESPETIAHAALQHIQRLVPHTQASVAEFDHEKGIFHPIAIKSAWPIQINESIDIPLDQVSNLLSHIQNGQVHINEDIDYPAYPSKIDEILKADGIRSYISIPLLFQENLIGALTLGSDRKAAFNTEHGDILFDIANQLAVAIQQAQLHERIRQHAIELERRVAERTEELQIANVHLEALGRVKDEFVSNVSHELRTPIANLKLLPQLLLLRPKNAAEYIGTLEREVERLEHLVEDLLSLSRLDQERHSWNPALIDLNNLCRQYVIDRILLAANQDLRLRFEACEEKCNAQVDQGLLGQVLSILLTNAINYTQPGGEILVATCKQAYQESYWVGFSVSDNGPGISAEDQPRVFERFYRGKAGRESDASGTGLGLAIAKEIIDRHQGRIEVVSPIKDGHGTVINVWLLEN
ncbi:MAG: PAS domain S-box protein [Anaerolineales bacterium]|nr:PAS domain S-box protein [Anaerolineales bacterium]